MNQRDRETRLARKRKGPAEEGDYRDERMDRIEELQLAQDERLKKLEEMVTELHASIAKSEPPPARRDAKTAEEDVIMLDEETKEAPDVAIETEETAATTNEQVPEALEGEHQSSGGPEASVEDKAASSLDEGTAVGREDLQAMAHLSTQMPVEDKAEDLGPANGRVAEPAAAVQTPAAVEATPIGFDSIEICSFVAENTQQKILNKFLESVEALDVEVVRSVPFPAGSDLDDIWLTRFRELEQPEEMCLKSLEALDAEVVRSVPSPSGSILEVVQLTGLEELRQHEEICLNSPWVGDQGGYDACGNYSLFWRTGDLKAVLKELRLSKSIFFMKRMSHSQKALQKRRTLQLYLPVWFFKEHGNKLEKNMVLRTNTSTWGVRLSFHTRHNGVSQVQIYRGWQEFVNDNRLRRGAVVLFVLNVDVISFQLHIFHAPKN